MDADITILDQQEKQLPDVAGKFRLVVVTRFLVAKDGPFSVQQEEASFDPAVQQQMIQQKAALVRAARA
jgi:hypothetical protein